MPVDFNDEIEREGMDHHACSEEHYLNPESPSEDVKFEAEDLLELDANDQLNILILESHALSIIATQLRNDFEMLHSRAFLLSAEWKLASLNPEALYSFTI